jgi:short subunit dehydrogenase-like uncharacterized protein
MMIECSMCLAIANQLDKVTARGNRLKAIEGGFVTPAVLGMTLFERLERKGIRFSFS